MRVVSYLFIQFARLIASQHVCDIEKTFPIYFVLSLFKQKLGSISSSQQFIFSSTYWHLTNCWNWDISPRVWCVKRFLVVFQLYLLPSIRGSQNTNGIFRSEGWEGALLKMPIVCWLHILIPERIGGGFRFINFIPSLVDIETRSSVFVLIKNSINLIVCWPSTVDRGQWTVQQGTTHMCTL